MNVCSDVATKIILLVSMRAWVMKRKDFIEK